MKTCPVCGKEIIRRSLTYCGMQCYSKAREKRVEVACSNCKNSFSIRPFEQARSVKHYCPSCRQKWENRQPAVKIPTGYVLPCYYCGVPIYRQRWRAHLYLYSFCSKACRSAGWRSLRLAHEGLYSNPRGDKNNVS